MTSPKGASTATDGSRRYRVAGEALPSANTILGALDRPALNTWKLKGVAVALANDPELLELVLAGKEWRAIQKALDAAPTDARDLGTAVHAVTELYDLGEPTDGISPELVPFLEQWVRLREDYGLVPVLVERTVAHPFLGYAGTLDRVMASEFADVAELIHPSCRMAHVLDVKTGAGVWPDAALQLAGYANAPHLWDPDSDTLEDMVPVCKEVAIVASVHADEGHLVPVSIVDAWPAFQAALIAWRWANELAKGAVSAPLPDLHSALPW